MKRYPGCMYFKENKCQGFNSCLIKDCIHSEKYQPWLFDDRLIRSPMVNTFMKGDKK